MDRERWRRIEAIYQSAAERTAEEREFFLAEACAGDEDLRREVESLLTQQSNDTPLDRPAWELAAGARLGPYELLEPIGSGGMGTVFKARDTRLNRSVAIKVSSARFSGRFANEARAVAALNHPHVCTLHDVGPNYLVMEFVEGETLARCLEKGALPLDLTLRFGAEIADAVAAAHAHGIIHRDLKPANIMLTESGVKVLDFGLAKFEKPSRPGATQTDSHSIVGTVAYMSPEQAEGKPVDGRSDIFSLGAVLYEMAAGKRPFRRDTEVATLAAILREEPEPLPESVPAGLARTIARCLRKDPGRRFQTVVDLKLELEELKEEWDSGRGVRRILAPAPDITPPPARRRRWISIAGAVAVALAVTGSLAYWMLAPATPPTVRLRQITTDSEPKEWPVLSDGSRIYFASSFHFGEYRLMQVPVSGGQPTVVSYSLPESNVALLDMSPDGQELLVVQTELSLPLLSPSPLWAVRVTDGRARRIGLGTVSGAGYSPDGRRIVWSTGDKLYVAAADGSEAREIASIPGSNLILPSWITPNSISLVRVEKGSAMQAWVIAPDGSGFHRLFPQWARPHSLPALTPDGRFMLLHSAGTLWSAVVPRWPGASWGGAPSQITFGTPYLYSPHRIRDGRMFALGEVRAGELQRFDPKTRTWQRHLGGISADGVEYSPDGQWVAYTLYPEQSLWRCRADGAQCLQLVDGSIGAYLPHWSPDGKSIAFHARESDKSWSRFSQASYPNPWRIWLVNADGGNLRRAVPNLAGPHADPAWTADGKTIVFGNFSENARESVFLQSLNIASGEVTKLPGTDGLWSPKSSPDHSRLLALDMRGSLRATLTILDPATGQWKKASAELADFPTWASDNKSIIYGNRKEIRRFRVDTWKAETIVAVERWHDIDANLHWPWVGQDAGGAPLVMRNHDVRQIYELELVSK